MTNMDEASLTPHRSAANQISSDIEPLPSELGPLTRLFCEAYEFGESQDRRFELRMRIVECVEQMRSFKRRRRIKLGDTIYDATRDRHGLSAWKYDLAGNCLGSGGRPSRIGLRRDTRLNSLLEELENEVLNVEYEHAFNCREKDERGLPRPVPATVLLRRIGDRLADTRSMRAEDDICKESKPCAQAPPAPTPPDQSLPISDTPLPGPPNAKCPQSGRDAWELYQFGCEKIRDFESFTRGKQYALLGDYLRGNLEDERLDTYQIRRLSNMLTGNPETWARYLNRAGLKRRGVRGRSRSVVHIDER